MKKTVFTAVQILIAAAGMILLIISMIDEPSSGKMLMLALFFINIGSFISILSLHRKNK
ncbi:MAG: hypothetical protein J6I96_06800 [Oscillospiraceae bacterium]|nr:hypothetical protein [Oscillospiraceae bacterium]